jgi:hypothetical protein
MKSANKFDEQESLPLPDNLILAIVTNLNETRTIIETLNRNGFSPDDIGLLVGKTGAEKFDAATGKKGFFAKMVTSGMDFGDRDKDYLEQYRGALLEGRSVLGVVAKDDETRKKARQILKTGGARFIAFFGPWVTEVWEA